MTEGLFIGLALIAVSAYHLVPALWIGEIPTTSRRPLTRETDPENYQATFWVFLAAGAVGVAVTIAATIATLLRMAGL